MNDLITDITTAIYWTVVTLAGWTVVVLLTAAAALLVGVLYEALRG